MTEESPIEQLKEIGKTLVYPELAMRMIEKLPDTLVLVDAEGKILFFNDQAELLFGYTKSEVIGHKVEMLIPIARREVHQKHRTGFVEEPRIRPMGAGLVLTALTKTNREVPVEVNLSPIVISEGIYTMAVLRRKNG